MKFVSALKVMRQSDALVTHVQPLKLRVKRCVSIANKCRTRGGWNVIEFKPELVGFP